MDQLTIDTVIKDIKEDYSDNFKTGLMMVPLLAAGIIVLAFVTAGKTSKASLVPVMFIGAVCVLGGAILFLWLRSLLSIREEDIEIIEDTVIDKDWYTGSHQSTSYYLIGLSGTGYSSKESFYEYSFGDGIYVVYADRRHKIRKIYRKKYFCLDEKLKARVILSCPMPERQEDLVSELSQFYTEKNFHSEHAPILLRQGYSFPKCPKCGKNLNPERAGLVQNCKKCGTEYVFTVRDIMTEKAWYNNELGDTPLRPQP